jgi:hypothetical protein
MDFIVIFRILAVNCGDENLRFGHSLGGRVGLE